MKYVYRICALLLLKFCLNPMNVHAKELVQTDPEYKLILSHANYPVSYDPLDADLVNNSDIMKLRYFAPIEINHEDKFKSSVLNSFEYDAKSFQMTWKVRSDLKYADGSELTPSDIVMAIKRMGLKRSEFPVLGSVKGLKEWSKEKNALAKNIPGVTIAGNTITISFNRSISNPFFQFSLALFSIQPSRCFDLKSSKLICDVPPASGYYDYTGPTPKLDPKDGRTPPIKFVLRSGLEINRSFKMPQRLTLEYTDKGLSDLVKNMDENSVARTLDSRLTDDFINQHRSEVDIKRLPKTAIWYLLLNPNFEAFRDKKCRRIFANKYRVLYGERVPSVKVATKSFPSPIMPGYLTNEQLEKIVPTVDPASCSEAFKKHPIKLKKTFPFWDKLFIDTMEALAMPTSGVSQDDRAKSSFYEAFESNETSALTAYVSFWPLDLDAGINMFFSPNMHSELKYLLSNRKLSDLSAKIFEETDTNVSSKIYEEINISLYDEAQLNALSYFGNVYISKGTNVNKLPIATSEPENFRIAVA